jgi:hypothetical protein
VVTGVMTGGVCLSVREREGERGWAGSGASWAGWLPGSAQLGFLPILFIFFFCFSFLFYSDFCLSFERVLLFRFERI